MSFLSLMASLGLNASGFETGLKRAESQVHHFGNEISSEIKGKLAAAFGGAAIEEAFRRTMEYAHKLKDLNLRTGLSTDELQTWDFAAERAGTTLDAMVGAMEKLGVAQAKALGPEGAETFQALQRLGLNSDEIRNMDDLANNLKTVFATVHNAPAGGQVLKDIKEALGRGAIELIPVMREGLQESSDRLDQLNGRLKPDQIDKMAESATRYLEIWARFRPLIADVYEGSSKFFDASIKGWEEVAAGVAAAVVNLKWYDYFTPSGLIKGFSIGVGGAKEKAIEIDQMEKELAARKARRIQEEKPRFGPSQGPPELTKSEQTHADQIHKQYLEETLKLELEQATAAEKKIILRKRLAEAEEKAAAAQRRMKFSVDINPNDKVAFEEAKLQAMKLQGDILHLDSHKGTREHFDSLARIGGFNQASDNSAAIRNPLHEIVRHTKATADATRKAVEHQN